MYIYMCMYLYALSLFIYVNCLFTSARSRTYLTLLVNYIYRLFTIDQVKE